GSNETGQLIGQGTEINANQTPANQTQNADDASTQNEYSAFISALQNDGLFGDDNTKISVVDQRIVIDGHTLDLETSAKYIPLLNGATNIEIDFSDEE
ncbi:MAG: hypothetical protein ABIQ11_04770, partial [Saprospiraceae bacterium]